MNDYLKQLMTKAGYAAPELASRAQILAELIVAECIQVCADRGTHHDGLYSAWAVDCSERIGKHFGVEE